MKSSSKVKFLVPAVSLVIIGFAVVNWLNARRTRANMEDMLTEGSTLLSESTARDTGGDIGVVHQMLSAWSEAGYVRDALLNNGAERGGAPEAVEVCNRTIRGLAALSDRLRAIMGELANT